MKKTFKSKKPFGSKRDDDRRGGKRFEKRFDAKRDDRPRSDKPKDDKRPVRDDKKRPVRDDKRAVRDDKPKFDKRDAKPVFEKREPRETSPRLQGPLLWGFHAVRAAWQNDKRRVLRLLVTESALEGFQETLDETQLKRPKPEIIDKMLFERMLPQGSVHQGIAALVEPLPLRDAHDLVAGLKDGEKAVILILDQVTDPHNVGAILRSAAAFGAKGVIMQDRHAPEFTGVLAKTASGAADVIPVAAETNLSRAIEFLQENDFTVIGLDERGDSIADLPPFERVVLVLGAEGSGLRQNVANHCDALASLPTEGVIKSLNVSNAAAVALYALKVS